MRGNLNAWTPVLKKRKHKKMSRLTSEDINAKWNHHEMPFRTQLTGINEGRTVSKTDEDGDMEHS